MPNFVTNAGEEVYVSPSRPVFRRGQRLDGDQIRRLRDLWFMQLCALGCDSEDIARTVQACVSSRQVRNRVDRHIPLDFKKAMQEIADIILSKATPRCVPEKKRSEKPRRKEKPPGTHRQLMLFLAEDMEAKWARDA